MSKFAKVAENITDISGCNEVSARLDFIIDLVFLKKTDINKLISLL